VEGRTVTIARPQGVTRTVGAHAQETVERALAPQATRRVESDLERAGSGARTAAAAAGRSRTDVRTTTTQSRVSSDRSLVGDRSAVVPGASRAADRPTAVTGDRDQERQQPSLVTPSRTGRAAPERSSSTGVSNRTAVAPDRSSSTPSSTRRPTLVERPSATVPNRGTGGSAARTEPSVPVARGRSADGSTVGASPRAVIERPAVERPAAPQSAAPSRTLQRPAAPPASSAQPRVTSPQPSRQPQAAPRTAASRPAAEPAATSGQQTSTEQARTRTTRQPGPQPTPRS